MREKYRGEIKKKGKQRDQETRKKRATLYKYYMIRFLK